MHTRTRRTPMLGPALTLGVVVSCTPASPDTATPDPLTPACVDAVELEVFEFDGTWRYYVDLPVDGDTLRFQLDTGSSISFLTTDGPAYEPELATLELPCSTFPLAGRNLGFGFSGPDGEVVHGLLGMDLLQRGVIFDPEAGTVRFEPAPGGGTTLPYDDVQGHAIVPVALDGEPVRLMFDTGAATMWLGQEGQPGDTLQQVRDAEGTILDVYVGQVELAADGLEPRTVRVERIQSFPYFEQTVAILGGDIHGLLGPESFAGNRLYIDGDGITVLP